MPPRSLFRGAGGQMAQGIDEGSLLQMLRQVLSAEGGQQPDSDLGARLGGPGMEPGGLSGSDRTGIEQNALPPEGLGPTDADWAGGEGMDPWAVRDDYDFENAPQSMNDSGDAFDADEWMAGADVMGPPHREYSQGMDTADDWGPEGISPNANREAPGEFDSSIDSYDDPQGFGAGYGSPEQRRMQNEGLGPDEVPEERDLIDAEVSDDFDFSDRAPQGDNPVMPEARMPEGNLPDQDMAEFQDRRNAVTRPNQFAGEELTAADLPPEVQSWVQALDPETQAAVIAALMRTKQ